MSTAVEGRWTEADLDARHLGMLDDFMEYQLQKVPAAQRRDRATMADYFMRNYRAYLGYQAHNYCHGRHCQSCGCGDYGPCVSHKSRQFENRPDARYKPAVSA